ncbi:MAG TPA: VOC family protein [Microbacteriaceae bacterium]|nr:VOC family protein [Microbacteriaceae bacterium]
MPEQLVRPSIWIQRDARAAIERYTSLIPNSRIIGLTTVHDPSGNEIVTGMFVLAGVEYQLIGGPAPFELNASFSLAIACDTQVDIDHYWEALVEGGTPGQCGWLVDHWGLSWQVFPKSLPEYLNDPVPERAAAASAAMFGMSKIVLAELAAAADAATPRG